MGIIAWIRNKRVVIKNKSVEKEKERKKEEYYKNYEYHSRGIDPNSSLAGGALLAAQTWEEKQKWMEIHPFMKDFNCEGYYHCYDIKVQKTVISIKDYTAYEIQFFNDNDWKVLSISEKTVFFEKEN